MSSADAELVIDDHHATKEGAVRRSVLLATIDAAVEAVFGEPYQAAVDTLNVQFFEAARPGDVVQATAAATGHVGNQCLVEVHLYHAADRRLVAYSNLRIALDR